MSRAEGGEDGVEAGRSQQPWVGRMAAMHRRAQKAEGERDKALAEADAWKAAYWKAARRSAEKKDVVRAAEYLLTVSGSPEEGNAIAHLVRCINALRRQHTEEKTS